MAGADGAVAATHRCPLCDAQNPTVLLPCCHWTCDLCLQDILTDYPDNPTCRVTVDADYGAVCATPFVSDALTIVAAEDSAAAVTLPPALNANEGRTVRMLLRHATSVINALERLVTELLIPRVGADATPVRAAVKAVQGIITAYLVYRDHLTTVLTTGVGSVKRRVHLLVTHYAALPKTLPFSHINGKGVGWRFEHLNPNPVIVWYTGRLATEYTSTALAANTVTFYPTSQNIHVVQLADGRFVTYNADTTLLTPATFDETWLTEIPVALSTPPTPVQRSLAADGTDVWLTGTKTHDITKYDHSGHLLTTLQCGQRSPTEAVVHADGTLVVKCFDSVIAYNGGERWPVCKILTPVYSAKYGLATLGDYVYFTLSHGIYRVLLRSGPWQHPPANRPTVKGNVELVVRAVDRSDGFLAVTFTIDHTAQLLIVFGNYPDRSYGLKIYEPTPDNAVVGCCRWAPTLMPHSLAESYHARLLITHDGTIVVTLPGHGFLRVTRP